MARRILPKIALRKCSSQKRNLEPPLYRWYVATLKSTDPVDRCKALLKLLAQPNRNKLAAFRRVRPLLKDKNANVRGFALETLARLGDVRVVDTFRNIIKQPDAWKCWGKVDRKFAVEWAERNLMILHRITVPKKW